MDIVSRLKTFINYLNIPVTQFADICTIPRPTLSQLLNGRNKKVSDELIGKIHESYPELSVLWLMFGEGEMLLTKNIEISEPKPGGIFDYSNEENFVNEYVTPNINFNEKLPENSAENSVSQQTGTFDDKNAQNSININLKTSEFPQENEALKDQCATINFHENQSRKVVNIIVYYSENSFESFVPCSSVSRG